MSNLGLKITEQILKRKQGMSATKQKPQDEDEEKKKKDSAWSKLMAAMGG